jgi:hypothetical protein
MVKTIAALTAAGVIAATTLTVPNKAEAYPVWVIPAIIAGAVGGVAVGAGAANANYAYAPQGTVTVQPRGAANCHLVRERTANGWRRVEVCG